MQANLSIVIPTYNNLYLFQKAFNSVVGQTLLPREIIVTDDSTSDEIENWIKEQNNSIVRYYHNNPSLGAVKNWNRGLELCTCDWIIVLHHDEELFPHKHIEGLMNYMNENDVIISDIRIRSNNNIRRSHFNNTSKRVLLKIPISLFCVNSIGPCACIAFKRSLLQYFDLNLTWLVDTEWYYRLMISSKHIKYIYNQWITSNHGHDDQITANIDVRRKDREDKTYLQEKYSRNFSVRFALKFSTLLGGIRRLIR